jgi:hypothetical protein
MVLAMTRPTKRRDCGTLQFKRRTPKSLLSAKRGELLRLHCRRGPWRHLGVALAAAAFGGELLKPLAFAGAVQALGAWQFCAGSRASRSG